MRANNKPFLILMLRPVAVLPQLDKKNQRVEPEEDDDRKSDPLHDDPGVEGVVVLLQDRVEMFLQPKRVCHPHAQVQEDEECDRLKYWKFFWQQKLHVITCRPCKTFWFAATVLSIRASMNRT